MSESRGHHWDDTGERCIYCGDKDWFAGPVCDGLPQQKDSEQPAPQGDSE